MPLKLSNPLWFLCLYAPKSTHIPNLFLEIRLSPLPTGNLGLWAIMISYKAESTRGKLALHELLLLQQPAFGPINREVERKGPSNRIDYCHSNAHFQMRRHSLSRQDFHSKIAWPTYTGIHPLWELSEMLIPGPHAWIILLNGSRIEPGLWLFLNCPGRQEGNTLF